MMKISPLDINNGQDTYCRGANDYGQESLAPREVSLGRPRSPS